MLGSVLMDAGGSALLDVVSTALLVGGVVVTVAAGAAVVLIAVTVRRVRRSGVVTSASLRLQAITASGPRREVARLRLELHRAVGAGNGAVGARTATGLPGEAPSLMRRIQREALTLDAQLRVMEAEDDPETLRTALPALRRRVMETIGLVRQLRIAVADGLAAVSASSMGDLAADVEREVIALRAGRERLWQIYPRTSGGRWTDEGADR